MKKYRALKILLTLLPALVFTQNWAWMSANKILGIAFIVIWALMIWSVWKIDNKYKILQKIFRATEIGFFLLPISAIILTFVIGAQAVNSTNDEFAQAGAAIGTAIGGTFIVVLAFIFGLSGGIILHLIANKYEKKAEQNSK
ncbi:MAG: hypothetical protein WCV71_02800 [Patescibacteria group bacterium]|jgi:high-affinity nickel permease